MVQCHVEPLTRGQFIEQIDNRLVGKHLILEFLCGFGSRHLVEVSRAAGFAPIVIDQSTLSSGEQPADREMIDGTGPQRSDCSDEGLLHEILGNRAIISAPSRQIRVHHIECSIEEHAEDIGGVARAHDPTRLIPPVFRCTTHWPIQRTTTRFPVAPGQTDPGRTVGDHAA